LESYVNQACEKLGNNPNERFCLKVVQTEELLVIRHCVFIMGPAGSGKSQCWRTLKGLLSNVMCHLSGFGTSRVEKEDDDLELGQTSYSESKDIVDYSTQQPSATMERRPLLSHATDSTLNNKSGVIRGRVPFIDSMDSDLDDGGSIALNGTASRFDGGISQRARGI
jgi:energy-coupling factor transporter ATP-binding protein EcfA2